MVQLVTKPSINFFQRTRHVLDEFPRSPFFKSLSEYWPNSANSMDREPFLRTRDGMVFAIEALGTVDPSLLSYFPTEVRTILV